MRALRLMSVRKPYSSASLLNLQISHAFVRSAAFRLSELAVYSNELFLA
jgi:hypothetical protein